MTLSMKLGGAWKEAQSLHVKIDGQWRDIATLYSKKDGVWITVYSSGALIEFLDYPYPIPVASGWKYSTDKTTWTIISEDGEINTSGTFTGFIKANSILLNDYYNEIIGETGDRVTGTPLITGGYGFGTFINGNKGYVCAGFRNSTRDSTVDVYDINGNRTSGTPVSVATTDPVAFVNNLKGYVCGGAWTNAVNIYNTSGNRTTGTSLSIAHGYAVGFVNNGKGYVCGGQDDNRDGTDVVEIYDSSGNRTTGTALSKYRWNATSFVNNGKGYVCGGQQNSGVSTVDVYDSSGTRTTGTSLSLARMDLVSFVNNNKGYVCGGYGNSTYSDVVDVYNSSGTRTTGTSLSVGRMSPSSFVRNINGNPYGYVCGGYSKWEVPPSTSGEPSGDGTGVITSIDLYDSSGNRSSGTAMSTARQSMGTFVNGNKGYVCGGYPKTDVVDIYQDNEVTYGTKLPITKGSTYTLNGESGTADKSKIMEFDSKVTGTIDYKKGTVPSS